MRILPNGKVGINCINPKFYLDVIGDGHYSGWLYVDSNLTIRNRLGINNFSPNFPLDINGRSHFSGWLFADSNLTVLGFIGINTTAQYPLDVKGKARISSNLIVNENVLIDKNLYLNNTNPTGYTLLGLNQYKQVIPIAFSGNPNEVLTGAGTFLELPSSIGWRVVNGNIVTTENGNVGIGTEHPAAKLHVEGDAIITGGVLTSQVILSDKLQTYKIESDTATTWISVVQKLLSENVQSKTASIDTFQSKEASMDKIVVDKAQLDSINAIITESKKVITDTLQTILLNTDSIEVDKATAQSVSIGGAVNAANEKLAVVGNTGIYGDFNVTGNLKTSGNITFAQDKTISYSPSNNNTGIYSFATPWPHPTVDQCYSPSVGTDEFTFRGTFHSWGYVNNNTSNPINVMQMGFDGANGIIDLAGTNPNGNTRLLINYYCGKDVYINTGQNGTNNVILTGSTGNVGIGVDPANAKLDINGDVKLRVLDNDDISSDMLVVDENGIIKKRNVQNFINNLCQITCKNDNVGVGNTNPYKKLTVNGDVSFANYNNSGNGNPGDGMSGFEILGNNQIPTRRGISLDPDPNGSVNFYINSNQTPSAFNFKNGNSSNPSSTLFTINGKNGKVGVGIQTPEAFFHVGNAQYTNPINLILQNNEGRLEIGIAKSEWDYAPGSKPGNAVFRVAGDGNSMIFNINNVQQGYILFNSLADNNILKIMYNGNVGIGTTDNPSSKLEVKSNNTNCIKATVSDDLIKAFSVEKSGTENFLIYGSGDMFARSIHVKLGTLGDFVFEDNYKLLTIDELDNFIKKNHHLPGIPSANEVKEKGMDVGEFQNLLLQKIEEQTLYIIELQKQVIELKKTVHNN